VAAIKVVVLAETAHVNRRTGRLGPRGFYAGRQFWDKNGVRFRFCFSQETERSKCGGLMVLLI
jgi:hypothetical protein